MVLTTSASAFMGIKLEAGAGVWQPELTGNIKYDSSGVLGSNINFDNLGIDNDIDSKNNYYYADLEHFIPIIPNARIEFLNYTIAGNSTLSSGITFAGKSFASTSPVSTEVTMKQIDYIAYWEVPIIGTLSAGILNINYGIVAKNMIGSISLTGDVGGTTTTESSNFDETLPLFYLNAVVDIPFMGTEVSVTTKTLSYDGSKVSDNQIKASINMPLSIPLIDFKLDIGYKVQNITLSENLVDNLSATIDTSGVFVGINARF
jgi:outer membrane protein